MSKLIKFYPKNELVNEVVPPPQKVEIPAWFKKISPYSPEKEFAVGPHGNNLTVKSCIPFLDTFSSGYVFNLWCDILVKRNKDGEAILNWMPSDQELAPIHARPDTHVPVPNGFSPQTIAWVSHWGIQTPKGYSTLMTHPLNRNDLPFLTSSGIMDTDKSGIWGRQPFSLHKDFDGVIEAGTPIIQFIPFKRELWDSKIDHSLTKWANYELVRANSKLRGYYKNKFWTKKQFN